MNGTTDRVPKGGVTGCFETEAAIAKNHILLNVRFERKATATMDTLQEKEAMQTIS